MSESELPSNEDLLIEWQEAKDDGATRAEFAEQKGISEKSLDNRLYKAKIKRETYTDKDAGYKVTDEIKGNYRTASIISSDRIVTYEQLVELIKIDEDEWIPLYKDFNKWEIGRKAQKKHLKFSHGVMDGSIDDDGLINVEPLFKVAARFVRKHPVPLYPIITPLVSKIVFLKPRKPKKANRINRTLVINDTQTGFKRNGYSNNLIAFHDRSAMDAVLQVSQNNLFDEIVIMGDSLDLPEQSLRFIRSPEFTLLTQPAINEMHWWFAQIRNFNPTAKITYIPGNHEKRINDAIMQNLPWAYGLKPATELQLDPVLSVPYLLGLAGLGIEYKDVYPHGEHWLNPRLRITHGHKARGVPGGTVSALIKDIRVSLVVAHIHRWEIATKTVYPLDGEPYYIFAASTGCLCKIDGTVPGHNREQHWQKGFGEIIHGDTIQDKIDFYPINNGRAIYRDHEYIGRPDRVKDFVDFGGNNTQ